MKLLNAVITLLLAVLGHANTKCNGAQTYDQMQSGIMTIMRDQDSTEVCYSVPLQFTISASGVQIAVSTAEFNTYSSSRGIDFSVRGRKISSSMNTIELSMLSDPSTWSSLKVSYFATSRNDIQAGQFVADTYSYFGCQSTQSQDSASIKYRFPGQGNMMPHASAFISGIKTRDRQINVNINRVEVNSFGDLEILLLSDANPVLENIHFSYIIWNDNSQFTINYPYVGSVMEGEYGLIGAYNFQNNMINLNGLSIASNRVQCIGGACIRSCYSPSECLANSQARLLDQVCIMCSSTQIFYENACYSSCPGTLIFMQGVCGCNSGYRKDGNQCILNCPVNQRELNGQCVCIDLMVKDEFGVCRQCQSNQIYSQGQCICQTGYQMQGDRCVLQCMGYQVEFNGRCICQGELIRDPSSGICQTCPGNLIFMQGQCGCMLGYIRQGNMCTLRCQVNETQVNGQCVCQNLMARNESGYCTLCTRPQFYSQGQCRCPENYIKQGDQCRLQCMGYQVEFNGRCICQGELIRDPSSGICQICPGNLIFMQGQCGCMSGYIRQGNMCTLKRPDNQIPANGQHDCSSQTVRDPSNVCRSCPTGATKVNEQCFCTSSSHTMNETIWECTENGPSCPPRSSFNQNSLACQCNNNFQYLINNICQPCGQLEVWNGDYCNCQTGTYRVQGVCIQCSINEYFDNTQCVCNFGYYRSGISCIKCHDQCGQCYGSLPNQCISCPDVSYTFNKNNSSCTKYDGTDGNCPAGLYLEDGEVCKPCMPYCQKCSSISDCQECTPGFNIQQFSMGNLISIYCEENCGDGLRFSLDCDDGNNNDGDGCSSECEMEEGWSCMGGSSTRASSCLNTAANQLQSLIVVKNAIGMPGKIYQSIRMTHIPKQLTNQNCMRCSKILLVRVVNSTIIPGIRTTFLPDSKYSFTTEFNFNGLFAIPVFTITIQINPEYNTYFSPVDMAQIKMRRIDPATLKRIDKREELTLNDISEPEVPKDVLDELFHDN